MDYNPDVLVESRTARDDVRKKINSDDFQVEILNRVKSLFFAVYKNSGRCTRQQLADFYLVGIDTIDKNYSRNKNEFLSDGVEIMSGTSYAKDFILKYSHIEDRERVGVLTLKELSDMLYDKAINSRKLGKARGEITKEFSVLRDYEFPETPESHEQLSLFKSNE